MTHLVDDQHDELNDILVNLRKKKIFYKIKVREGKVIYLDTKDKDLIKLAKKNNPELK